MSIQQPGRARRRLKSGREPTRSTTRTSVRPPRPKSRRTTRTREVRHPPKRTVGRHEKQALLRWASLAWL